MKIVQQTGSRLVLKDQLSSYLPLFGWTAVLAGIPLALAGMILMNSGVVTLACERQTTQVVCEQGRSRLLGMIQESTQPIGPVSAAEVATQRHSRSDGLFEEEYRLMLTRADDRQVESFISLNHYDVAEQMTAFLQSAEPRLLIQQDNRRSDAVLWGLPLLLMFPTVAIASVLYFVRLETMEFDRAKNRFYLRSWQRFRLREQSGDLSDVEGLKIRTLKQDDDSVYQAELLFASGRRHKLAVSDRPMELHQMTDRVARFLNIDHPELA